LSAFNNIMDNYVTYDRKKIADDSQMKYRFSFAAGQFNKYYNELIQKG